MSEIVQIMPTGRQLADSGIAMAQEHAEACKENWTELVMAEFGAWVLFQDAPFAVEDFRAHIATERPELLPPTANAWGAIGRLICKRGLARFVGIRPARSRATRSHYVRVFVKNGGAQ